MLELLLGVLCILLLLLFGTACLYVREQQRHAHMQAYIHGALAGAALGISALYLMKSGEEPGSGSGSGVLPSRGVSRQELRQRVSNLRDMFADVLPPPPPTH